MLGIHGRQDALPVWVSEDMHLAARQMVLSASQVVPHPVKLVHFTSTFIEMVVGFAKLVQRYQW